ncbi:MAG: hypothetical protein HOQ32_20230 [Lysobacter sp.]|nr:hypothetical protein [Lysobacter sp.]
MKYARTKIAMMATALLVGGPTFAGNGGDNSESAPPVEDTFQLDRMYLSQSDVTRQTTVVVGDGAQSATVVYDAPSDRVYLSNPSGVADVPLMQIAMTYSGGDPQIANEFANSIRQFANSAGAFERTIGPSYEWRPPSPSGGACDLSPCGPGRFTPDLQVGDFSRQMGIRSFDYHDGWWELTHDPGTIEQDKRYFEIWRKDQCEKAADEDADIAFAVAGAVVTCPAAETGLGAAACGMSIAQLMRSMRHDKTHRTCKEGYPGPGLWGQ